MVLGMVQHRLGAEHEAWMGKVGSGKITDTLWHVGRCTRVWCMQGDFTNEYIIYNDIKVLTHPATSHRITPCTSTRTYISSPSIHTLPVHHISFFLRYSTSPSLYSSLRTIPSP